MPGQLRFPKSYSEAEIQVATRLIRDLSEEVQPYRADWKATWLLSDLHSERWIIGGKNSQYVDGQWQNVRYFYWDFRLFNGSTFTEPSNSFMREAAQKIAFLWRLPPDPYCNTSDGFLTLLYSLGVFIRWIYVNEDIYDPAHRAFSRIDESGLYQFSHRLLEGGVPWALGYPWALLEGLFKNALGMALPESVYQNPLAVSEGDRNEISKWLKHNGFYVVKRESKFEYIDRKKIADEFHFDLQTIKSHSRFSALLRLFEPTIDSPLMIGKERRREYPSHRVPLLSDAQQEVKPHSCGNHVVMLKALFGTRVHLPEFIPDTTNIHLDRAISLLNKSGKTTTHTPWIPLKTALIYTNVALKWIHLYGEDLVDHYIDTCKRIEAAGLFKVSKDNHRYRELREKFVEGLPLAPSLAALNIRGWTTKMMNACSAEAFAQAREFPSLNDAMSILIGSCILVLTFLKPIRSSEIADLRRNCFKYKKNDGYWITQSIAKKTFSGHRIEDELPIPYIVAKALEIVDTLGQGMRSLTGNSSKSSTEFLFFVPERDVSDQVLATRLSKNNINAYLDRFCDWVNLECDSYGRRWYVRTHEARKSFILTFFWCFRYASLEAARWIAGHSDSRDVYAYIEANFPGMELPAIEAQYASEQLKNYVNGDISEVDNVRDLERVICKHFNVSSISILNEKELNEWLEIAFARGTYRIEPYSITVDGVIQQTQICFRIRDEIRNA